MISKIGEIDLSHLTEGYMTPKEQQNIRKAVVAITPKTQREKDIQTIAGRSMTAKQQLRHAGIGAASGMLAGILGGAIQGENFLPRAALPMTERRRALLAPRRLIGGATVGAIYGALMPNVKRQIDIAAAKSGEY